MHNSYKKACNIFSSEPEPVSSISLSLSDVSVSQCLSFGDGGLAKIILSHSKNSLI